MAHGTQTVEALATEASGYVKTLTREDGSQYVGHTDDAPEWVRALCYHAHGDFMPDDWRYECIRAALLHLADGGDEDEAHDFADTHVDVYTGARLQWLASNLQRPGYCDEAQSEGLAEDADVVTLAGLGQYMEATEVFGLVVEALRERLDEDDDA